MNLYTRTNCPHCGHLIKFVLDTEKPHKLLDTCEKEDGGCGKEFAMKFHVRASIYVSKVNFDEKEDDDHGFWS